MNKIRKSMEGIRASEELKQETLRRLLERQAESERKRPRRIPRYAPVLVCLCFFLIMGGYTVYGRPVSYISIDVNPSIELGTNRFGKVVSAVAYNEDGQSVLEHISLKNISYMQAIDRLLTDEAYNGFLTEDSMLVFTVISDRPDAIIEKINENETWKSYGAVTYVSDRSCMKEAHQHEMSFGKYRAYQELAGYDETITVEECHGMTMREIRSRIDVCRGHEESEGGEHLESGQGTHGEHEASHGSCH